MDVIYREITQCRICGNKRLIPILHLGHQSLTGFFPKTKDQDVASGPLELVKCDDSQGAKHCGLLQLKHSYESTALYGQGYGYRSSLNKSMVSHLHAKVKKIVDMELLKPGDLVIDIGSNDGTLLKAYPHEGITLAGIDPSAGSFKKYYPSHVALYPDFFSAQLVKSAFGSRKAKVITSIAMFYDLEAPVDFMQQVYEVLDDQGVWVLEQSYMPTMLKRTAYDTVCHEHLEYYGLKQIQWMTDRVGFKIVDVELNDINGGSFSVMLSKNHRAGKEQEALIARLLRQEAQMGLSTLKPYEAFKQRVFRHREELCDAVKKINNDGKKIIGYGASTKGNVILQFCGFIEKDILCIAEVNQDKFGSFTPGTLIPIISEAKAKTMKPDYMMVLPWHFKENIVAREQAYLKSGGKLFFPLPQLEIVDR
ncbi:MAG: class I SAM-dependent methyltransferase [Candidatus Omnitrophica bacterium]|nr:class I SAM-dependent methyltransferase [Candidatus Omnitrophota bacterium]